MKIKDIPVDLLGHWVARAKNWKLVDVRNHDGDIIGSAWEGVGTYISPHTLFNPMENMQQCVRLIEQHVLAIEPVYNGGYYAGAVEEYDSNKSPTNVRWVYGDTLQEAACRAVLAEKYGTEIPKGE